MRALSSRLVLLLAVLASAWLGARPALADDREDRVERVQRARQVYVDLAATGDRVPQALRERCKCVAVFPRVLKGALGFGARRGHGVASCRDTTGTWSPVSFFTLTGGSWGLQIGVESAEVVLFFMTERSARSLLESKFTLGGKAGVAAGPVGRTAEASTDLKLDAEIYSYARSKGLFAGLSLEGARLATDDKSNRLFYGRAVGPRALLFEHQAPTRPAALQEFLDALK